ncbi:MAG: methyltransferase domain-containing protein [Bauldia sp.]
MGAAADWFRFISTWIRKPGVIGAVSPSGPALTRLMASGVPESALPVLELGPGTGVVTRALLERGIPAERLILVEYDRDFCRLLSERFPGVKVVNGDAYDLAHTLPPGAAGPFAAVVSSLPLMVRPAPERRRLVEDALNRTVGGKGPLIQFSYAFTAPVPAVPGSFSVQPSRWVLANVPPARVWTYRRP